MLSDFPKLNCPFVRRLFTVNVEQWKKEGASLNLREPEVYLVIDQVNLGFEWVFEDPDTIAVEKLNGTNVKILTENGRLIGLQNRLNVIDPLQVMKGKTFIIEGIFRSLAKGYVEENGEQCGELIGPKVQGNPLKLEAHEWYPFAKAIEHLRYKSFHEHERTFDNWSQWFRDGLFSRYYAKRASKLGLTDQVMAEGIVFYNLRRKAEGKTWMAKLRRDMFDWYYSGTIEIHNYDKQGSKGRSPSGERD
jgi:hypothetical protein